MTLAIDTSIALRSAEQLRGLADALYHAGPSLSETRYIEWKGTWDLRGSARDKFSAAKHILGFANRNVEIASRIFEGCASVVAGVEPGTATGVPHEDSATLTDWLSGYLGTDGPAWSPHWITVAGVTALVLAIEAPLPGDRIHTLRKAYDGFARVGCSSGGRARRGKPILMSSRCSKRVCSPSSQT